MAKDFYKQYIEELLTKMNMAEVDGKLDTDYVQQLAEEMKKRVGLAIMDALPKEKMENYAGLINSTSSPEKINSFLQENIEDFEKKRMKAIEDFAVSFVERTTKMREALK